VLHMLRRALPDLDSLVEITPHSLQWRSSADCSVDIVAFEAAVAGHDEPALKSAVDLYVGDYLRVTRRCGWLQSGSGFASDIWMR
jgi:hypothetical protein